MYAFVYGTLKRNCPNHYVLTNPENGKANFVSEGRTVDLFPLIVTTEILVPFLLDKKGTGKHVLGEVYEVDEKMLNFLDKFERTPSIYIRTTEQIQLVPSGEIITAGVFTFHNFLPFLLEEEFLDNYVCHNFDELRALSGQLIPDLRKKLLYQLRGEVYYANRSIDE